MKLTPLKLNTAFFLMICSAFNTHSAVIEYGGDVRVDFGHNYGQREYKFTAKFRDNGEAWNIELNAAPMEGMDEGKVMYSRILAGSQNGEVRILSEYNANFDNLSALKRAQIRNQDRMSSINKELELAVQNNRTDDIEKIQQAKAQLDKQSKMVNDSIEYQSNRPTAKSQARLMLFNGTVPQLIGSREIALVWLLLQNDAWKRIPEMTRFGIPFENAAIKPEVKSGRSSVQIRMGKSTILINRKIGDSSGKAEYSIPTSSISIHAQITSMATREENPMDSYIQQSNLYGSVTDYRFASDDGEGRFSFKGKFDELTDIDVVKQTEQYKNYEAYNNFKSEKSLNRPILVFIAAILITIVIIFNRLFRNKPEQSAAHQ